jgi:hypothetical protein
MADTRSKRKTLYTADPIIRAKGITSVSPFYPTAPGPQSISGIDATDDRIYAINGTGFFESRDRAATFGTDKGGPANLGSATAIAIVRWGSYLYTVGYDTVATSLNLYRALPTTNRNDAFSWSTSLLTLTAGSARGFATTIAGSSWGVAQDALIVADYGPDPTGGPSIWRSTDGTTWTKVLGPIAATRHIHAVFPDPYRQGHWWMTAGDGTGHQYYRSTDYGVTWTKLTTGENGADLTLAAWQSVQISADATGLYFAGDSGHFTCMKLARKDLDRGLYRPIASPSFHQHLSIPNGKPGRGPFSDGVITAASANFDSATAAFTSADVGRFVSFTASINPGGYPSVMRPYIVSVTSSTRVVLSMTANGSGSSVGFTLGPETLFAGAFYGCVDPATGVMYQLANDSTSAGTRCGLFATLPDGRCILLESWGPSYSTPVFVYQGFVYCGRMKRPLISIGDWAS